MASGKILKFGVPIANQAVQTSAKTTAVASVRHQTGQCGIDPYKPAPPPPPPIPEKFPEHLLRPPCMPGSGKGRFPPDCEGMQGFYCPPQRLKYKYPPFSENIDFVPSGDVECWWTKPNVCNVSDQEEELPIKLP